MGGLFFCNGVSFGRRTAGNNDGMIKQLATIAIFAALAISAVPASAQVYVQIAPPAPIVETVPAPPGSGYVWLHGHYNWNGNRYVWVGGHYERHAGQYCEGHWRHDGHGYIWVDGHWC